MDYLSLPFMLREGYLDRGSLYDSLSQSVGLLISTRAGSLPFDPGYGCDIWEKEFSDILTSNRADIRSSIRNAIDKYEKRLYNVSVSVISRGESGSPSMGLAVRITANFREDDEEKKFEVSYTLG